MSLVQPPNPEAPSPVGIGTATRIANHVPHHPQRPTSAMVPLGLQLRAFQAEWLVLLNLHLQSVPSPHQPNPIPQHACHGLPLLDQPHWSPVRVHPKESPQGR